MKEEPSPNFTVAKGEEEMMIEPDRTNSPVLVVILMLFCKRVLKNEAINIYNKRQPKKKLKAFKWLERKSSEIAC